MTDHDDDSFPHEPRSDTGCLACLLELIAEKGAP